ncbi:hypothetical protein N9N97_00180, partial [Rickettsiaceae bacterium]|nr:hypothetical protein [Rickettsiaceae bacterium]
MYYISLFFYILQKAVSVNKRLIFGVFIILLLNSPIVNANQALESDLNSIRRVVSEIYAIDASNMNAQLLSGGASGDSLYFVKVDDKQLLLRIYKIGKPIEDRKLEVSCTKIASDLGVGPRFLYASKGFNILATNFVEGATPT